MVLVEKGTCFSEGWKVFFFVNKNAHVFAKVAILNCSGGKSNMFFRGVASVFSLLTRIRSYLPERVAILKYFEVFCRKRNLLFRGSASLFSLLTRLCMYLPETCCS